MTHNIEWFATKQIHEANPSKGWSMRSIQDQAAKEFPLWSKEHVYDVVRSTVLKHCNLKE
jgi:hypothetical protein